MLLVLRSFRVCSCVMTYVVCWCCCYADCDGLSVTLCVWYWWCCSGVLVSFVAARCLSVLSLRGIVVCFFVCRCVLLHAVVVCLVL